MTTYSIALNFEDGVTRVIQCDDDEKVTDAAFRQKINLPMDCRDGVCGTCKCFVEKGAYELEFYMDESMSDEEAEQGYALTCQMIPESDCVVRVPTTSALCKTAPESVEAEVLGVDRLSETSFGLRVKLAKPVGFLPGQYVNVSVPGAGVHRSYSFSSAPGASEATFLIRNLPGGIMSSYLSDRAQPGDALTLTGPMGTFYLRPIERAQLWLAGGTGLAPFMSMLEQVAEQGSDHPITLYYAVTRAADLVELDRVMRLAETIGNVTVVTVLAEGEHARTGFVTDHLTAEDLCEGEADVYLCGPPPMVDAVRAHFAKLGVEPSSFHFEKFNPTEEAAEAA
ncbi:benzoate 1,2-dioxygenase electron transfer component BenC [Tropicibacter alexandrii]|uniref:benzoate 1,2-dioxygenase electron transfer component BenC n=1 Tax=Tropicibacter alexandrii TaxID=2267683 RepID=UPI000EF43C26|nr:benzoate 1,2-dioxygenase electron transfer component BenC [Tropicibacter alexandrii]